LEEPFKKVVQNIWLHLTTFQKSGAKNLAPPYHFSKKWCKRFGSTLPLFKKVVQKIWLHLTTFQKSGAKDLAPPFLKVDFLKVDSKSCFALGI
jgi:hypothetical protein